ncbi:MAG: flagellar protein FliS [Proteobacteria bacterium]|nr:flagellar protein FliS [Pseudomonadota bacterium]
MKFHHPLNNKNKLQAYTASKHLNVPFCEQIAILFDTIAKKINKSEALYEQKEFEKAYHIVKDNINLVTSLSEILTTSVIDANDMENANTWHNYFVALTQSLVLLASNHNEERKEKILVSVHSMATMWRKRGEEIRKEGSVQHVLKDQLKDLKINEKDNNLFVDA